MGTAAWVCSAITIVSALVSLGFSVAGLRAAAAAGRVASEYALARSIALALVAVIAPITGDTGFIAAAAVAMIAVQGLDAVVGARVADRVRTFGPVVTAAVNAVALVWLVSAA
ncbi:hypothetical protein DEJ28_07925 [Curtobacterium sp. MCPF17_002]|uniref:hypothetical protein n=1 Tax=Curtobacterium sp. MCPF17_002 TaxID=2175645 RepID=UPI0021ABFE31|nr:hypothetical protein [Curtobacterium sp. MCPF17_002]WIB79015.1 hypothetical protein DEJ28_07925 [Curtobacterium sp. MCPF17_002]